MPAIDFKRDELYKAKKRPQIVDVPDMLFLTVEGEGAPGGSKTDVTQFQAAIGALYNIVYTLRYWDKKHPTPGGWSRFSLAPLEGIWWTDGASHFALKKLDDWHWKILLRVPDFVTPDFLQVVIGELMIKKPSPEYQHVKLEHFHEGLCAQIMHVGPYEDEQPDIDALHAFIKQEGYTVSGRHHELYFGDPWRTKPENLRTILRYPIKK